MMLTLPDDIPSLKGLTESEVRQELAFSLYAAGKLTVVQAADLAVLGLFDFQARLRDRRIPQHYEACDLEQDLLVLREL